MAEDSKGWWEKYGSPAATFITGIGVSIIAILWDRFKSNQPAPCPPPLDPNEIAFLCSETAYQRVIEMIDLQMVRESRGGASQPAIVVNPGTGGREGVDRDTSALGAMIPTHVQAPAPGAWSHLRLN